MEITKQVQAVSGMSDDQLKVRGFELVNMIEMIKRDIMTINAELNDRQNKRLNPNITEIQV